MGKEYKINVYDTITKKYINVTVSKDVYHAFNQTAWKIKDNNKSYYSHEIQFSGLIGGENGNYENFHEFISDEDLLEQVIINIAVKELPIALSKLNEEQRNLIIALFYEGETEQNLADIYGISQQAIHKRKCRILKKLKNILD